MVFQAFPRPTVVMLFALMLATPVVAGASEHAPGAEPARQEYTRVLIRPVTVSEKTFNAVDTPLLFAVEGARFATHSGTVSVFHNDRMVPRGAVTVTEETILVSPILQPGRNRISIFGGVRLEEVRPVSGDFVFWAGEHRLRGTVVDRDGQPVPHAAITVVLAEAARVSAAVQGDASGRFELDRLPPRAVHVTAQAAPDLYGVMPVLGDAGRVEVRVLGIAAPSDVDNSDFSKGLEGWETGDAPVQLVPSGQESVVVCDPPAAATDATERRRSRDCRLEFRSPD